MKKKTLSILISVLMTLCLLFCFTGCRDKIIDASIYAKDPVSGERLGKLLWDREVHLKYTGEVFDIREVFDIKVINSDTGKEIKQTYATIKAYLQSDFGPQEVRSDRISQKGVYFVDIEWNHPRGYLKYTMAFFEFYLYVE